MANPTAAMLVIGDEILSGRTHDQNTHHLAQELTKRGIDLKEARVVSDESDAIITATRTLAAQYDHLFTSGGIGPTHDDITAEAIAQAMKDTIDIRADARAILQAHYKAQGQPLNAARLRMARIPSRARLIENPISKAPGFTLDNVHVMAGIPAIFQAMLQSLLPQLTGGLPLVSKTLRLQRAEGDIAEGLSHFAERFQTLSVGCYPFQQNGIYGANILIRGTDSVLLEKAYTELEDIFAGRRQP